MRSRGYDIDAVDWFLDQLARPEDQPELATVSADLWRGLAVANYFTRSGPGDLADRIAAPSRRARPKYMTQDKQYFVQECADEWRDFGQQPGTHLRYVRAGAMRRDLRTAEQQTVASLRYGPHTTVSTGGRTFIWKRVTGSSWPDIAEVVRRSRRKRGHFFDAGTLQAKAINRKDGPAARAVLQLRQLIDETGMPVLYASGRHMAETAGTCITFPDQRWLWFPVRGTTRGNAIMTAIDQGGTKVARYRIIASQPRWNKVNQIEITVHPGQPLTDELLLAIAISASWVSSYFNSGGGGGG